MDVHARGEPLVNERSGELIRLLIRSRRQDNHHIGHDHLLYLVDICCTVLPFVSKDETRPTRKRRARTPAPVGPGSGGSPGSAVARRRKIVYWLLVFVASIVLVDGLVGERGLLAMLRARHEYDALSASISRQRADNARLREEARRLNDDPSAIEEIARRELGLIRPGEKVFIVRDAAPAKP